MGFIAYRTLIEVNQVFLMIFSASVGKSRVGEKERINLGITKIRTV